MKFGKLDFVDTETAPELLAEPTLEATRKNNLQTKVFVSEIDSSLADTAAFCETDRSPEKGLRSREQAP